jgi:type IX secretion system PorP/SprF family membrane protein
MKSILKLFILLLIPVNLAGQLAPLTSQYVLNPLSINPAYAGNREALNVSLFYRRQWAGITGAPETMTFAADAPFFDSKLGLGFMIINDKIGVTKETHMLTNYSYKIAMDKSNLSFGLGAGLMTTNTAWSDLVVLDPGDENFLSNSKVFVVPDFSFGIYYTRQNFFGGVSVPKLLAYKFVLDKNKYSFSFSPNSYTYLINTGYIYSISQRVKLFPSVLVAVSPHEKLQVDINTYLGFNDRIWAGFSYRNNRSLGALLQCAINNQLRIAYTYDIDFGPLGRYSNGSHEIMLRYEFRYKVDAISPLSF